MNQTLEVRWFYDGTPPRAVIDWFMALNPHQTSECEDLYLISDDPSLNVKLRKNKIQIKRRSGTRTPITFCNGVTGACESWQKWSFPLTDDAPDLFGEEPSGHWLPVLKRRHQRTYRPAEQRRLLAPADVSPHTTTHMELTQVQSYEHRAWTICMEAEGRAAALPDTLERMGRYLFQQDCPPALTSNHSYGYIRWLARVHHRAISTTNTA